ncbi:unnamed protein product [Effrenium voratum]|nr:unnamed protein product [Effrenium voratum]
MRSWRHGVMLAAILCAAAEARLDATGSELLEGEDAEEEELEYLDDEFREDEGDLECHPPLSQECPYPCRCCDGPGPADCVICPAGFACIDSDEDGAGQCMEGEEGSNVCDGPGGSAQDYRPGPEDEEFPEDEGDSPWSDDQESDFLEDQEGAVPPDDDEVEFVEDQEDGLASDDHGSEDFIDDQDNQPAAHDEM